MDEGAVIMSGLKRERILESLQMVIIQHENRITPNIVSDYDVDNVSMKVSRIIIVTLIISTELFGKNSSTR